MRKLMDKELMLAQFSDIVIRNNYLKNSQHIISTIAETSISKQYLLLSKICSL